MAIDTNILYLDNSINTLHLDKNAITKAAQLLDDNLMTQLLSPRLFRYNSMSCGQSDKAMIQADVLNTIKTLSLG